MPRCKLVLAVNGRDIDTFAATHQGLLVAQRAAQRAAASITRPHTAVLRMCEGGDRETLVRCTAQRCTSGLAGARRRPRRRRW